ncbi:hypothetical protein H6504_00830 [Candidatus Woesearchaeota archaeon]|nr:hypothetical protein [Candidatus Woesearchaeota archaeon]
MKRRVESLVLEQVIIYLLIIFAFASIALLGSAAVNPAINFANLAIIEMLIIIIMAVLAQTIIMIRIYRQYDK